MFFICKHIAEHGNEVTQPIDDPLQHAVHTVVGKGLSRRPCSVRGHGKPDHG